jgi:AcrR family transcriptional regulator
VPRAGLTPAVVVAEAARVADRVGLDRLTLASVAQRLGVALPSLYKHVRGLEGLQQKLAVQAVTELTAAMTVVAVGRSGRDALHAVADAYRAYAKEHPGRYAASLRAADPDDPAHTAAATAAVDVFLAVLSGYGIEGDRAIHATRAARSMMHGFVALENAGGFGMPQSVEESYDLMVDAVDRALRAWP